MYWILYQPDIISVSGIIKMINNITNISINSAILESTAENNLVRISVSYQSNLSLNQLTNYSLRLFLCTTGDSIKYADYISQRHNEFLIGQAGTVRDKSYVNFLEQVLGQDAGFISTSSPFSPYSTNLESRNLVITDNVSVLGQGQIIPQGIIIYDINLATATTTITNGVSMVQTVTIELPQGPSVLATLACHCYMYDNKMPQIFIDESENNLALNTGMTPISKKTFFGTQTSYVSVTPEKPLVGMQSTSELVNPDESAITVIQKLPQDSIEKLYTDIANKISETFQTNNTYTNYNTNKVLNRKNYFTDFWMTKDSEENNRFIFSFDIKSYLMDNSLYPFVYDNPSLSDAVLTGGAIFSPSELSSVQSVEVYRHVIDSSGFVSINNLGTQGPGSRLETTSEVSPILISEINQVQLSLMNTDAAGDAKPIVFYEGCDNFSTDLSPNTQINGKFQYSVKCSIRDNSPEMMRKLVDVLYAQKNRISLVYDIITADTSTMFGNVPAYNIRTGILNIPMGSIPLVIDGEESNAASVVLETLSSYESILNALNTDADPINLVSYYENQLATSQGRIDPALLKEIETIIDLAINFVHDNLVKIYPSDPFGQQHNTNRNLFAQNTSRSTRRNILNAEHRFTNVFEKGKTEGYGLDYIFDSSTFEGFRSLSVSDLTARRQEEFRKYFFVTDGSSEITPQGTYEDSSYAYFTPKIIRTPGRSVIDQPSYSSLGSTSTQYDYDRYGQLYADIISLFQMSDNGGEQYAYLKSAVGEQSFNNKNYASIVNLLHNDYSVVIADTVEQQFKAPTVTKGNTPSTIYNVKDKENCGSTGGLQLIQSVIGGESTTSTTAASYFKDVNGEIKEKDQQFLNNSNDVMAVQQDLADRAIKLPFVILGELTINKQIEHRSKNKKSTFNSLKELGNILSISEKNIDQEISGEIFGLLPNQLKNMIVVASTINSLSLGDGDGSLTFDARRFSLNETGVTEGTDLVSFYNEEITDRSDIYALTEDPMKNYARFLTFWMNYRQLSVVEYLDGFGGLESVNVAGEIRGTKYKLSNWKTLTSSVINNIGESSATILCRVRLMQSDDYLQLLGDNLTQQQRSMMINYFEEKEILDLPTYNQYFYINNEVTDTEDEAEETETVTSAQTQQTNQANQATGTGY
jgi:hypothetical protein